MGKKTWILLKLRKVGYLMDRYLDGVYFRIKRNGKYENVCFSDLTEEEMNEVMNNKDEKWLKSLAVILGKKIKEIGD